MKLAIRGAIVEAVGIRTLLTLAALLCSASTAWAGQPGSGNSTSAIAAKICAKVQHDLGSKAFKHVLHTEAACEAKAGARAQAAVTSCLAKNSPGTESWRQCIDAQVAAAARSLEPRHR